MCTDFKEPNHQHWIFEWMLFKLFHQAYFISSAQFLVFWHLILCYLINLSKNVANGDRYNMKYQTTKVKPKIVYHWHFNLSNMSITDSLYVYTKLIIDISCCSIMNWKNIFSKDFDHICLCSFNWYAVRIAYVYQIRQIPLKHDLSLWLYALWNNSTCIRRTKHFSEIIKESVTSGNTLLWRF